MRFLCQSVVNFTEGANNSRRQRPLFRGGRLPCTLLKVALGALVWFGVSPGSWPREPAFRLLVLPAEAQESVDSSARSEDVGARLDAMDEREHLHDERKQLDSAESAAQRFPTPGIQRRLPSASELPWAQDTGVVDPED